MEPRRLLLKLTSQSLFRLVVGGVTAILDQFGKLVEMNGRRDATGR
jgi:hypothetical protein